MKMFFMFPISEQNSPSIVSMVEKIQQLWNKVDGIPHQLHGKSVLEI